MLAEERLRAGEVEAALASLQDEVRKAPGNAKYRVFLFQLLSVLGRWDRALTQLKVLGDLDPMNLPMVQTYRELLKCEVLRAQVFAGRKTPLLFGEPEEWVAFLVEAVRLDAEGHAADAEKSRARALDTAPTTSGTINDQAFEWIADGDVRLGPILEVILNGRYTWVPFSRLQAIAIEQPTDLRDFVWMPATLTLATGAQMVAFIPSRYPETENSKDGALLLAKRTDWTESGGGYVGIGQRVFVTDAAEVPLLDVRQLLLSSEAISERAPEEEPTPEDG
jgi:type VI secretion system protein ImpE